MREERSKGNGRQNYRLPRLPFVLYRNDPRPLWSWFHHQDLSNYVESFVGISERIAVLNIKFPGCKDSRSVIQVFSPTEQSEIGLIKSFYLELNKTIQDHAHKNFVVMGDFNGQIGIRRMEEETVLGPFVYGKKARSRNAEKLVNFALENGFKVLNTVFKKRESKRWTWISPDGNTKN